MGPTLYSIETFDPSDLAMLRQVYRDAWGRLSPDVPETARDRIKETVAVTICDMARAGQRDPELLWCGAVREGKRAASQSNGPMPARMIQMIYTGEVIANDSGEYPFLVIIEGDGRPIARYPVRTLPEGVKRLSDAFEVMKKNLHRHRNLPRFLNPVR